MTNDDKALFEFFAYAHLPEKLQIHSKPFQELAGALILQLPKTSERTMALRKLLEAKDCAVRAALSMLAPKRDITDELVRVPRLGERIFAEESGLWFEARKIEDGDHKGMVVWMRCVSPVNDLPVSFTEVDAVPANAQ